MGNLIKTSEHCINSPSFCSSWWGGIQAGAVAIAPYTGYHKKNCRLVFWLVVCVLSQCLKIICCFYCSEMSISLLGEDDFSRI